MNRSLYMTFRSPYARKVRILLIEKGLDAQMVPVDLANRTPAFFTLNPAGKVPVLVEPDGTTVFDSTIIAEYLEDHYPDPPMYRADRLADRLMEELGDTLSDQAIAVWKARSRGDQVVEADARHAISRLLNHLEHQINKEDHALLSFGVGAASVVSALGYLEFRLGESWRQVAPMLAAWFEVQHQRPSVGSTRPRESGTPADMWNERYAMPGFAYGTAPNDFLRARIDDLPDGPVLSLAEGEGRNALFLATNGHSVTAVEMSWVALNKATQLASEHGIRLHGVLSNLADYDPGEAGWAGVVLIWCHLPPALRQQVHARVVRALKPGGVVILEAYTPAQLAHGTGGPQSTEMLYTAEMLKQDFAGLEFLVLEEKEREVHEGRYHNGPSAVVQLVARKP